MLKLLLNLLLILSLFSCAKNTSINQIKPLLAQQQLAQLVKKEAIFRKSSDPFNYQKRGDTNAKLPNLSPEKLAENYRKLNIIYQGLKQINEKELPLAQQIDLSVLSYTLKNELDSYNNHEHFMPLTAESGFHVWIANISKRVNMTTKQDYQDYLARLNALPKYFDQQIAWMNEGIEAGITQPQVVLQGFEQSIKAFIKNKPEDSSYYQPFKQLPTYFSFQVKENLQYQAKQTINKKVFPSYQKFYQFMVERYQPMARKNIAASSLPNGERYYQNRVNHYTTLSISADSIHKIGVSEVARIKKEMTTIIAELGFTGSFADFIQFLRTDPQFYAKTPRELLKEAAYLAKKMDGKLPKLFKTLPRTPYSVDPVPANIAPKYTTGRYSPPAREDQAGSYWVNTYRLDRRPLYVLPALTLHEAVPGHHLQGSIAREMQAVPKFRNNIYISAFGEGWGLYSEYLGIEAGMYETPYQQFGRLTYEMWRACRLVVDTGIHTKGWTRQQSIDYLAKNTALSLHNVTTEIDRYISWPAQALSYKMGEITIKRLRKAAEEKLGEDFDVRIFHDKVLENGSMPLFMLEKVIYKYIKNESIKKKIAKREGEARKVNHRETKNSVLKNSDKPPLYLNSAVPLS